MAVYGHDNPDKVLLDRFEQEFPRTTITITLCRRMEKFTPETLGAIGAMTEDLWSLPMYGW